MKSRLLVMSALVAMSLSGCGERSQEAEPHSASLADGAIVPPPTAAAEKHLDEADHRQVAQYPAAGAPSAPAEDEPGSTADAVADLGAAAPPPHPPWFRPDVWPGAKVESESQSVPEGRELLSSQILLLLPAGTTVDECAETLGATLKPHVPNVREEAVVRGESDRLTLRGEGDGYHVTIVCGREQGEVKAYLSYQWNERPVEEPVKRPSSERRPGNQPVRSE